MGLKLPPIPDDYGVGNDCLGCHPPGQTPNYVFVRLWDIVPCPPNPTPPNGHTFICAQNPFADCYYRGELNWAGHTWVVWYFARVRVGEQVFAEIQLTCHTTPDPLYFYQRSDPCTVSFTVNNNTCPPNAGTGGHAHVQVFVPQVIILLTSGYHFVTTPGVLYDIQDVGMDHQLIHLAHRNDKTNILIYIDSQDLEFD